MRFVARNELLNITNAVVIILMLFLGGRILLRLFSANPQTPFVVWVYNASDFLMIPFRGIFRSVPVTTGGVIDIPALFSIAIYLILGLVVTYLIQMTSSEQEEDINEKHTFEHHRGLEHHKENVHTHLH